MTNMINQWNTNDNTDMNVHVNMNTSVNVNTSGTTRLTLLVSFVMRVSLVEDHCTLLHDSPLLKNTCVRQVV